VTVSRPGSGSMSMNVGLDYLVCGSALGPTGGLRRCSGMPAMEG
jgi:hypothetical protein